MDNTEPNNEPAADTMWLEIGKDFVETKQITLNSDGELECEAVGSPPPKIFWLKNGMPIESVRSLIAYIHECGLSLRIKCT